MIIQNISLTNSTVYDGSFNSINALLYIDLGNPSSYSGSGTTYTDLSSNANNGTSAGSPVYSNQYGGYVNFNGAGNQYIATPTAKYNKTYTGKTVFIVARLTSITAGTFRCLFGTAAGTRNFNTYIYSPSSGVYQIHYSAGGGGGFSNNISLTLGQWFSIAVTQTTDGTVTYYFNGQPAGTNITGQTFTQWVSNGNENIGVGDNYWYGDIALCAAYGRALNASEIQQNHNTMAARGYFSIITSNLAIWIDANSSVSYPGTGTGIVDLSGNNRTQNLALASQFATLLDVKCFDCNSNSITAASIGPVLPTTGFTYIAWAKMKSSSADYRTLFRSSPDDHAILIQIGSNNLGMWDNSTNFHSAGYDVTNLTNVWTQWAVTGDSTGQTFYINGQQVGTVSGYSVAGNSNWLTGGVTQSQNFGYIANMLMYTAKLSQSQIQQNYTALRSRFNV